VALKSKSNQKAQCIAILGTGSDVGKSIIATAMCRFLSNQGIRVAPFKAQNMSNNSGVTPEGLEMGRAQIVQAEAARLELLVILVNLGRRVLSHSLFVLLKFVLHFYSHRFEADIHATGLESIYPPKYESLSAAHLCNRY
jgi:hypothetical protein